MSDGGGFSLPSAPAQTPGLPENYQSIIWEKFDGLNTKSPRPAIQDGEFFWGDGWMPIGPSNARVLYGTGPVQFTTQGTTVVWMGFGNIGDTSYGIVLQADGAVHEFNTTTGARFQIMGAGAIQSPTSVFGFSQWGSQYLIFTKDQTNGYWLWDDTNLFTAGNVGPVVNIDATGSGYSSPPTVTLHTTGSGTGATYTAQLTNDTVSKLTVTNPGAGFGINDFATLTFAGGGTDDQAVLTPVVATTTGGLAEVYVISGGAGYSSEANAGVDASQTGGVNATVSIAIQNGTIIGAAIVNPGTGYITAPNITVFDFGIPGQKIPGGSGATLGCAIAFGQITGITVNYGGTGYVSLPVIQIVGDGAGAVAVPQIVSGSLVGITMTTYGTGYTKALAVAQSGNNAANATPSLMPFGISGTTVEVAFNRVWVSNGSAVATFPPKSRTIFSDPNTPVGFSNGGGAFQSTDSFLRVGYHWLKQTNGFLYLGGDSSVNNISNVQTTASGGVSAIATTTFGNQNTDPQIGSPWPSSVQVFGRNIIFANSIGVYVSYGGAVTKASLPLDGFYNTGSITGLTSNYSSAVAVIFGIPVYMLLLPVVDQFTGLLVNKLLMYDGKRWFTSQQDRPLTYVATQEINSVLTAWGTDGTYIFQLFAQPSVTFAKVLQSKLFSQPGYFTTKTAIRLTGVVRSYAIDQPLTVTIDNEVAQGTDSALVTLLPGSQVIVVKNGLGATIPVKNQSGTTITVGAPGTGLSVFGPYPIGQAGRMIGMTVQTNASDIALLSLNTAAQVETVNL